jgi:mRNA-degrading endonuclease toxin of MazEF toxin-antitoxin module
MAIDHRGTDFNLACSEPPRADRRCVTGRCRGLVHGSAALCHQVTTLDRGKLGELLGCLSANQLRDLDEGLKIALGLP